MCSDSNVTNLLDSQIIMSLIHQMHGSLHNWSIGWTGFSSLQFLLCCHDSSMLVFGHYTPIRYLTQLQGACGLWSSIWGDNSQAAKCARIFTIVSNNAYIKLYKHTNHVQVCYCFGCFDWCCCGLIYHPYSWWGKSKPIILEEFMSDWFNAWSQLEDWYVGMKSKLDLAVKTWDKIAWILFWMTWCDHYKLLLTV